MIRPSSKTSSHSPDDDDDIYSKIPDIPPSPTSPDSMSIDMPLINSESQNKVKLSHMIVHRNEFLLKPSLSKT